jgi:hypothetical protein
MNGALAVVDVTWTELIADPDILAELADQLTVERKKYDPSEGRRVVVKRVPFLDRETGHFLTGLLPDVRDHL